MRLPDMYFFLCGQFFSFSHSGISATASRLWILCRSVLAINYFQIVSLTIRTFARLPILNSEKGQRYAPPDPRHTCVFIRDRLPSPSSVPVCREPRLER